MTRAPSHGGSEKQRLSRKSHRKSRNGCDNCKRRRIKCNEAQPQCSNCIKHSDRCSFLLQHAHPASSPGSVTTPRDDFSALGISSQSTSPAFTSSTTIPSSAVSSAIEPALLDPLLQPAFSLLDMELLHNYETATCYTLLDNSSLHQFSRTTLPQIGFSHPFVLHSILSISALHLAHFKQTSRALYVAQAERHHQIALRTATALLPNINEDNCAALYIFATLCSNYTLAMGPKKGDFLLFGDSGVVEWKLLFRGVKAILESNRWLLRESELSPMFAVAIRHLELPSANNPHLQKFRDHIVETESAHPNFELYMKTLEMLGDSFKSNPMQGGLGAPSRPSQAFVWLYRVSDEYVQSLQAKEPVSLVIFAHFCVLLHEMNSQWWIQGWVDHLMSEIYACLSGEHKLWMSWPMEEIGWIPQ